MTIFLSSLLLAIALIVLIYLLKDTKRIFFSVLFGAFIGTLIGFWGDGFSWLRCILGTVFGIGWCISGIPEVKSYFESEPRKDKYEDLLFNSIKTNRTNNSLELAQNYINENNLEAALKQYDNAIQNGVNAYRDRAYCLSGLDFHLDAIADIDKAISLEPEDCNLYYERSLSKEIIGDYNGAISDLKEAIRLSKIDTPLNKNYKDKAQQMGTESHTLLYYIRLSYVEQIPKTQIDFNYDMLKRRDKN